MTKRNRKNTASTEILATEIVTAADVGTIVLDETGAVDFGASMDAAGLTPTDELLAQLDAAEEAQLVMDAAAEADEMAPEGWTEVETSTEEAVEEPTVDEIADAVGAVEAQDTALEAAAEDGPSIEDEASEDTGEDEDVVDDRPLEEIVDAVADEAIDAKLDQIEDAFDARASFERTKNAGNESIQASLKKSRSALQRGAVAALFAAINVDPDFICGSRNTGSAYNVYAIDKIADLVAGLNGGYVRNAINLAVCKSLFRFRAAGEVFTGEMARAAASDKLRVQGKIKDHLVRHTVSASTAPTQASSTMSALQTLGIVVNKGSMKSPIYELTDAPQTLALQAAVDELPKVVAAA